MKLLFCIALVILGAGCRYDKVPQPDGGYPEEISRIVLNSCAVPGCHSGQSAVNAAGLDLSSWSALFAGSRTGAAVIPYSPSESFLLNFSNTYPDLGLTQSPVMPPNAAPLSRADIQLLKNWILNGAPDKQGQVAFQEDGGRKKAYVVNQGCDVLSVIDVRTGLQMRSVQLGLSEAVEAPHNVRVSPDGKYAFVVFLAAPFIQYINTRTDQVEGQIYIGAGQWNTIVFSPDGKYAFAADFNPDGKIACIQVEEKKLLTLYQGGGFLVNPHGQAVSPDGSTLWVAAQTGNFIYRLNIQDPLNPEKLSPVILDGSGIPNTGPGLNPHEIVFSPDGKYLFSTCEGSNEVRVTDVVSLATVAVIPAGGFPQEMAVSDHSSFPYLFVSCMEDTISYPSLGRGSVRVINWKTLETVYQFYPGYQPHGIAVDAAHNQVWVSNRNIAGGGPAPHHSSSCSGNSGYVNYFNISDGKKMNAYPIWLSVDPYSIVFR